MMLTAGAWALLAVAQVATTTAADLAPTNTSSAAHDPRIEALVLAAHGIEQLAAGQVELAVVLLTQARERAPEAASIARDLATALARSDRPVAALVHLDAAKRLGDRTREGRLLEAMLLARLDRRADAARAARAVGDWEGALLGSAVGDTSAAEGAVPFVGERTPRGALTALALAALAGQQGFRSSALNLSAVAEDTADAANASAVLRAARALRERLGAGQDPISGAAWLKTSVEYATNPTFASDGSGLKAPGLRWSFAGEVALLAPVGTARVDAALRVDQQVYLVERETLRGFDLTGIGLAAGVEVPIDTKPNAASVGFAIRFRDAFGDLMRRHYATAIEAGPRLAVPLDMRTRFELGLYGTSVDYIDLSPADAEISSQNRDRLGQRVLATIVYHSGWLFGRADALFLRDDAQGDAFDSRGVAVGGMVAADVGAGLVLRTGLRVAIRQYGPVGDEAVIGSASKRTEVRTAVELGADIPLTDWLQFTVEDTYVSNAARAGHAYTENVISFGLETIW